jgi:hypothetical protein
LLLGGLPVDRHTKELKKYPSELVLMVGSSAKDASDAPKKIGSSSWLKVVLVIVLGIAEVTVYLVLSGMKADASKARLHVLIKKRQA